MGKYVRKPKTAGEVAVMELSQPSLGVRTRAKTLALRRQQNSSATVASAPVTGDGSYLQLRSRRVEKPPIVVNHHDSKRHKQQRQGSKKDNPNLDSRIPAGSGSNPEEEKEALLDEDEEEIFPPSGVKYAERLQFQEALMSSTVSSKMICNPFSTEASSSVLVDQAVPQPKLELVEMETKEAVESSLSFCEICVERKENDQMFTTGSCNHSYCYDCVSKHVLIRVEENTTIIRCPGVNCGAVLELDKCRPLLPEVVIHRWEDALCQEFINASQRFYCPFRDCSASLLNDGGEVIQEAECPFCHRLFCAQCYVPWHPGIGCEEFQKLNEDEREREDLMVRELAKKQKWARCPKCKYYVERTVGCPHMICRCNFQFCYGCGKEWSGNHGGCSRD